MLLADFNPSDPFALRPGSPRQQQALEALARLEIFPRLEPYHPSLVGTIPLGIDIPSSDLDIILTCSDLESLEILLRATWGKLEGFSTRLANHQGLSLVCNFVAEGFDFEIFAQDRPIQYQMAYRHFVVELALLKIGGPKAINAIRQRKLAGQKTEPAFADYFNLAGDPYQVLYELSHHSIAELITKIDVQKVSRL